MVPVSQPFLPPIEKYNNLLVDLWETKWLTNNGAYVQELEKRLTDYLEVSSLHFVNNGTIALQLSIKALQIKGEVITTPFSFVATTTSLLWENCEPVFVDINPATLCIDTEKIEEAITDKTEAILATHVFGIPCDVEKIEEIAKEYNLKVIYDAAHAFGVKYKGKSLLSFGNISTLSFHATKLFHTVEGGGIVNNTGERFDELIKLMRSFGFTKDDHLLPGINAKNSEFHAAMGVCNLEYIDDIIEVRKAISELYDKRLSNVIKRPIIPDYTDYNYAYYPVIFESESQLLNMKIKLEYNNIQSRRYFYPSLNKLPYIEHISVCEISENISKRVLCLPLYHELSLDIVEKIANLIVEN